MQHRAKIDLKLSPGNAWGVPRGLPGASRRAVRARFETQLKINEKIEGFREAPGTSREPPRDPEGPQKSTPKRFFAKKGRSKREFSSLFARKAVVQPFCKFFSVFFTKNPWKINEKNDTCFHSVARFFEHGDPHETLYFTIWKLLRHFWCSCVLFLKSIKKMAPKFKPQFYFPKAPKSGPGDPFWVPKWSWINVQESKDP